MRRLLLFATLSLLATAALAQRPSTLGMTCAEANGLVAAEGAIVLATGRHTFDRFVANAGFCRRGEYAYDGVAPTADTPNCRLGLVCKTDTPLFDDFFDIQGR